MDFGPSRHVSVYLPRTRQREFGAALQTLTTGMQDMSQFAIRRKPAKRRAPLWYVIAFCVASSGATAYILPSSQVGILFDHIPDVEVPVIAEVTVINKEPNAMLLDGTLLAVLNVKV